MSIMKISIFYRLLIVPCIVKTVFSQSDIEHENSTISVDVTSSISNVALTKNISELSPTILSSIEPTTTEIHPAKRRWKQTEKVMKQMTASIVKKILPVVIRGAESLNISTKCSRHLLKFLSGVKQMKLWAFEMLDSSGKLPNGVLSGTINSLGNYDECVDVNVADQFQGRYCTVELLPPLPPRRPFVPVDDPVHEFINFTAADTLIGSLIGNAQHYYYLNFRSSVCVPSTCSRQEVEQIAKKVIEDSDFAWDVQVPNCEIKESLGWTTREIVVLCVVGFVLFVAFIGTTADIIFTLISKDETYKQTSSVPMRIFLCFSVYSNTKKLLRKDDSPDSIKIFHGMKVVTVLWVILNHTYYYINLQVFGSLLTARVMGKDILFQFVLNGFLNVETFFFISAVLVVYGRMKASDKEFNCALYIFRRLWRLTPPFMFVIACTFLVPRLGSGAAWRETVGTLVDNCKMNWWSNLLYFNNFVNSNEMCMQWMWYIPVDTHLYLLALLVLLPIKHRPRLGFAVIGVLFAAGIISTAVSNVYYELHPTAIYAFPNPEDIVYFIQHGYFKTHLHAVTYCVGMTVGYFIATRSKLKIPTIFNVAGWVTCFTLALAVLYGVFDWNQGNVPSLAVSTLYTCTNKLVWSLALGWVTVSCVTGNGGIASSILSWPALVPLSRLTYMAYLVHPVIQHMYIGSTRNTIETEHRTMAMLFLGYVPITYIVAYVFSQLFECPFMALEKVMFSAARPRSRKLTEVKGQEDDKNKMDRFTNGGENGVYTLKIKKTEDALA